MQARTSEPWTPSPPPTSASKDNRPASTGFALGLVGLVAGWVPIVGLAVTIPALLLSRAGRARFRDGRAGSPGRSGAGLALGWTGTAICVLMTVFAFAGAAREPQPAAVQTAAAAPSAVLISVPDVVGMSDAQARQVLTAAGFTNVVLGPSNGPIAGVAAGIVTTQTPRAASQAAAGDAITLGEAQAPPAPATRAGAPGTGQEPVVGAPHVDAPRPLVAAPRPVTPAASAPSSVYYANCTEAKAAGAAPLYAGQPGYRKPLDRDGDGVACEK
jgi:hypothetical protein